MSSTISESFEYYDPQQPMRPQQYDTDQQLKLPGVAFEDSDEIIADKMCDDTENMCDHSISQYEFFTRYA